MPRRKKEEIIDPAEVVEPEITQDRLDGLPRSNYFDDADKMSQAIQQAPQYLKDKALSRLIKPK